MRVIAVALAAAALAGAAGVHAGEDSREETSGERRRQERRERRERERTPEGRRRHQGHIHGYLMDPAGRGLTGIIALETADGRHISTHDTHFHRKGRFDIDHLEPGRYRLRVLAIGNRFTGYAFDQPVEVEVRDRQVSRPEIRGR